MEKRLLSTEELAYYLGVSPKTVRNWRSAGKIPQEAIVPLAGVRYDKGAIDKWLQEIMTKNPKRFGPGLDPPSSA